MNDPRTIDDLSEWFLTRFNFWAFVIIHAREYSSIQSWAMDQMANMLRPLPVRLRNQLLDGDE